MGSSGKGEVRVPGSGERGAGPLELIGLDKEWGGREGGWVGGARADINFTNSCPVEAQSS